MGFDVKPKFVTFDMNGTLIKFAINDAMREVLGDRLPAEVADEYLRVCKAYRIDECMGDYKPFDQIVANSMERASRWVGLEYREEDARAVYEIVPTWGPYPGVTEALNRLAEAVPLVIITNSDTAHAVRLAKNLQAPFEVVITAEQMGVYKPRLACVRVHVRQARRDTRRDRARLREPDVRPPLCGHHGHQEQGVRRPRFRA